MEIAKAVEDVLVKWKTMAYILIDTGCRRGELMGLQRRCVDLDEGTEIRRTYRSPQNNRFPQFDPGSTFQSVPVFLSAEAWQQLRACNGKYKSNHKSDC